MEYQSVEDAAKRLQISARSVRNYCAQGRMEGAVLKGKTWYVPSTVLLPTRKKRLQIPRDTVLAILKAEMEASLHGGLYHKLQIHFTYSSNHMEGSRLTQEQTRYIFETKTLGAVQNNMPIDDIVETANHFRCIDTIITSATTTLTEAYVKRLHAQLKNGTTDSLKQWFAVGDYKKRPNSIGDVETVLPARVSTEMKRLLSWYKSEPVSFERLLEFHVRFELFHPFQDGNGRVGRLLLLKECLKHNILPFIIDESLRFFYYRGLKEWAATRGYLLDTCRTGQDRFAQMLTSFGHQSALEHAKGRN